ncbi:MAG: ABC transporter ATP-binding protein, partial [Traorella sp.]
MRKMIEIHHLCKSFNDIKAVDDISFSVNEGELFAFLGVNGAGKSTTIRIICNQLQKDSGDVKIYGLDIQEHEALVKRSLGVVFQNSLLDVHLSVYDNLKYRASLYDITGVLFQKRLNELSELLDFKDLLKRSVSKLSGGQRRRIDIARALIHEPKILILDEPTTGLDPQTRKLLWDTISKLRKEKKLSVLLTTHYMEEANEASYVVILDRGKMVASGTPLDLKNRYTKDSITFYGIQEEKLKDLHYPIEKAENAYRIVVDNP